MSHFDEFLKAQQKGKTMQHMFEHGKSYYMVTITETGEVILQIKENGLNDTWSLPIKPLTSAESFLW